MGRSERSLGQGQTQVLTLEDQSWERKTCSTAVANGDSDIPSSFIHRGPNVAIELTRHFKTTLSQCAWGSHFQSVDSGCLPKRW